MTCYNPARYSFQMDNPVLPPLLERMNNLKVDAQTLDDHQVKLKVEIDSATFDNAKHRAARKLARRTKIPGFRPGKAPYQIIVRHLGEGPIVEEAIEITVEDIYPKVIEEANIEPYGPGKLEDIPELDPPTFEFIVPLRATVDLGDYRSVRVPYEPPQVTDEDVEDVVNNLLNQQALIEPVDRPAEEGDIVNIHLSGKRKDLTEDEDPNLLEDRPLPVLIEPESLEDSDEWPFPGFSRKLVGKITGDEVKTTYTYTEDSPFETLREATVEYKAIIEDVRSRTLPEANAEFAQTVGDYESMDELLTTIRQNLEYQAQEQYDEEYDNTVLEQIVESSTVKYPPQMLENEINNVIGQLESRLATQGLDIDLYLKTQDIDMDGLREESLPVAESRIKKSLVLLEISDNEDIQVDPDELQNETERTLNEASRVLDKKDMRKLTTRDATSNLVGNIMMDMVINKTQERLKAIARGLDETSEAEEEQGPDEDQESEKIDSVSIEQEGDNDGIEETTSDDLEPEIATAESLEETTNAKSVDVDDNEVAETITEKSEQ